MQPEPPERMIFIVGSSRSGTTMLGRIFGRSAKVYSFPELHLFGPCVPEGKEEEEASDTLLTDIFCWLPDVARNGFFAKRNPDKYLAEARELKRDFKGKDAIDAYRYFLFYETRRHNRSIPCEDLPGNIFRLEIFLRRFPGVKIIQLIRDPRDILLSQKNRHHRRRMGGKYVSRTEAFRVWANYHPVITSLLWKRSIQAGLKHDHPSILRIRFEDLVSDPEKIVKQACEHAGIDFELQMLQVPQVGSSTQQDNPDARGIDKGRLSAWKKGGLTETEIAICEKINGSLMKKFGYIPQNVKPPLIQHLSAWSMLPFKAALSLAMNLGRTKGLLSYLQKRLR